MTDTIARAKLVLEGNEPPGWPVPISKQLLRDLIALAEGQIQPGYVVMTTHRLKAEPAPVDAGLVL
jgi:hypothetical protein